MTRFSFYNFQNEWESLKVVADKIMNHVGLVKQIKKFNIQAQYASTEGSVI